MFGTPGTGSPSWWDPVLGLCDLFETLPRKYILPPSVSPKDREPTLHRPRRTSRPYVRTFDVEEVVLVGSGAGVVVRSQPLLHGSSTSTKLMNYLVRRQSGPTPARVFT